MALKSDRFELQTDISFFCDTVLTRGDVVVMNDGTGSGAAMDQGVALVKAEAGDAGSVPAGILLNDVVNKDLTRTHLNQHKDEVQKGGKVTVLRKGYVVTNAIDSNVTPAVGDVAYLSELESGKISNVSANSYSNLVIGRFLSAKDADGYAKVEVNLP
jgi:hypothetical protein